MATTKEITLDAKGLDTLHEKLTEFMQSLPGDQAELVALVLARASAAKAGSKDEIDEHLSTSAKSLPGMPTVAMLAKAIDGEPRNLAEGPDAQGNLWAYTVWTYQHKTK